MQLPDEAVDGKVYNAGEKNHSVSALAEIVCKVVGPHVGVEVLPTDDPRSYHVSSEKIAKEWGWRPKYTIEDAVREMVEAHKAGKYTNPLTNPMYFNIKRMQEVKLT